MHEYRVSAVLAGKVDNDPEALATIASMDIGDALNYVCEMYVDSDIHDAARDGWVLDDVFAADGTGDPSREFCYEAVVSKWVWAGNASLALADVSEELSAALAEDGVFSAWELSEGPAATAVPRS